MNFEKHRREAVISGSLDTSAGERPPRGRLQRHWRMRQDHLCGKPPHQRRPNKVQSGSHPSIKQPVAGCFALRQDSAGVLPDPRRQSSNDTPVQPQPQAVGAARRDPRRGEIPVMRVSAVRLLPPRAREVVSNRANQRNAFLKNSVGAVLRPYAS